LAANWWDRLDPKQKKEYIKSHPRSKYAKQSLEDTKKTKSDPKPDPSTTKKPVNRNKLKKAYLEFESDLADRVHKEVSAEQREYDRLEREKADIFKDLQSKGVWKSWQDKLPEASQKSVDKYINKLRELGDAISKKRAELKDKYLKEFIDDNPGAEDVIKSIKRKRNSVPKWKPGYDYQD
jgi:hypothetical protein